MNKNLIKILSVGALAVAMLAGTARATYITGSIKFGGGAITLDNADLSLATQVVSVDPLVLPLPSVTSATGVFALQGVATNATVSVSLPWSFASGAHNDLWTVTANNPPATVFTFDLTESHIISQTSAFVNVSGTGFISAIGYDDTPGIWTFTSTSSGDGVNSFSFVSATTYAPDGGTTALLLGLGLLGMGFAARRAKSA